MEHSRRIGSGWALTLLVLGVEVLGGVWFAWKTLGEILRDRNNPELAEYISEVTTQGVSLLLVLLCGVGWITYTFIGALRKKPWSRASNLTVQVLVLAAATGIFQGIMGTFAVGVLLLCLSLAGIAGSFMTRPQPEQEQL